MLAGKVTADVAVQVRQSCVPSDLDCVAKVLTDLGAPVEAISNFADRGGQFLLATAVPGPLIALAIVADPWKANSNESFVVLGGIPTIQFINDRLAVLTGTLYQPYDVLRAAHPGLASDPYRAQYTAQTVGADTVALSVLVPLVDGCRACGTGAAAQIVLTFDKVGRETANDDLGPCALEPGGGDPALLACPKAIQTPA